MIIKTTIGKGFAGSTNYLTGKEKAEILHGEGLRTDSAQHMIKDFAYQASQNPGLGNKVWHASISFNHSDQVTPELMKQIAQDYAKKFGFDQYAVIRHHDTKHEHFHILANRVKMDGQTVSDQYCRSRGIELSDRLAVKYNLEQDKTKHLDRTNTQKLNPHERAKLEIYKSVQNELKGCKNFEELQTKLKPHGIDLQAHSNTGGIYGVSFKQGSAAFKGSQLGKDFTAKALSKTFESALNLTPIAPVLKAVNIAKNLGKGMGI